MVYTLFKFLHIVGAIVWIGGAVAVGILNARVAREKDQAALSAVARQTRSYGAIVVGPAAGLTLIAGIVMIATSGLGVPLWVIWGLAVMIVSMALGGTLISRTANELSQVAATANPGDSRLSALQQRLATLNTINVVLLLTAVAAMVFKPTL